jgi:superfamily I DNA and/or RNA helicase
MHPDVAYFPFLHFYREEQLRAVPLPHQQETDIGYDLPAEDALDEQLKTRRVLFIRTGAEAQLVADLLHRIYRFTQDRFDPAKTVGVIVPYRRQIALIRQAISGRPELLAQGNNITIDTVERFQGSQRDVIIYALGVTYRYQLDFLTATTFTDADGTLIDRKLNVALTRARKQMIIVGRPDILNCVPLFKQLVQGYQVLV